jgi:uncharacterized protein (DUF924 family)
MRRWFEGGAELDAEINARFGATVDAAMAGALDAWQGTPRGRLALILLLDQLTRNRYRGTARMYAGDAKAQAIALAGLDAGEAAYLSAAERVFLITPLHHAENLALQRRARQETMALVAAAEGPWLELTDAPLEQTNKYNDVIERFGRFPHRNAILGRDNTPEEEEFLVGWAERMPPQGIKRRMEELAQSGS